MKTKIILIAIIFLIINSYLISNAQNNSSITNNTSVKTIWDIPHKTIWQKWMWIHRSIAFKITKERPVNYDTTYIKSYYKRLVITFPISTRFLKFRLFDLNSGSKIIFSPNLQYNIGIGVSSRWATFIYCKGVKLFNNNIDIKGVTKYKDYQLNLYGRKITTDMFVQYYSGFYIKNSKSFNNYLSNKPYAIRADVNSFHMGVSSYYIVNYKKFSSGNSFAFVEQQKKSAGSLLLGLYYSYFEANGSPSLVTQPFRNKFDSLSLIHKGQLFDFGLNLGYIYTFVFFKKCHATASFVQGAGGKQVNFIRDDNSTYHQLVGSAGKLHLRLALGYDNGRYIIGATGMYDYFFLSGKSNSTFDYSFGKFMLYIGYRFSILKTEKKLLHHLKLIDY